MENEDCCKCCPLLLHLHENKQVPYQHQSSPSRKFPGDYSRNFVPDQQRFPGASPRDKSARDDGREERETIILLDKEQEKLRDKEKILHDMGP